MARKPVCPSGRSHSHSTTHTTPLPTSPIPSLSTPGSRGGTHTHFHPHSWLCESSLECNAQSLPFPLKIRTLLGSFLLALLHFPESPKDGPSWPTQCPGMKCIGVGSSDELKPPLATLPDGEQDGGIGLGGSTSFSGAFFSSTRQPGASSH